MSRTWIPLFFLTLSILYYWPTSVTAWPRRVPHQHPRGAPSLRQVPCLFIFGDSLVDNGNNNELITLARANYLPYGIDFPQGVTGRFTNGRTYVDVLAQLLGFRDYIPPYATTSGGRMLLRGLNYASGGAGIRNETGNNLGGHTPINGQVAMFGRTTNELKRSIFRGNTRALNNYLRRCIFYSGFGSNDYLNNYFMPTSYNTAAAYTPVTYATSLLRDYSLYLTELYKMGARKVVVMGIGPIGCIPYELARYSRRSNDRNRCNETINSAIRIFNSGLLKQIQSFNRALRGAKFLFLDSYQTSKQLTANAKYYGFTMTDRGCCGVGRNNGQITCLPLQAPCPDHRSYFFWDAFHPTEAANLILANLSFSSSSKSIAYPMNIQQLAKL